MSKRYCIKQGMGASRIKKLVGEDALYEMFFHYVPGWFERTSSNPDLSYVIEYLRQNYWIYVKRCF